MEFVGRKDHQVKIRGYRMELGEIEARIHSHSQVKETLVTDFEEAPGQKALCAYVVAEGGLDAAGLRAYLAQLLPEYMVPGYFMFLERMPLTINGKIDRAKLPRPEKQERAAVHYAVPTNETERKLAAIWQELLGIEPIGVDDHFFDLGGHSLKVAQLQARIYETFQVNISFKLLFEMPHIRSLASLIAQLEQGGFEAIEPAPDKTHYRLAPAQQRMYAMQQRMDIGMAYHVPLLYRLPGTAIRSGWSRRCGSWWSAMRRCVRPSIGRTAKSFSGCIRPSASPWSGWRLMATRQRRRPLRSCDRSAWRRHRCCGRPGSGWRKAGQRCCSTFIISCSTEHR